MIYDLNKDFQEYMQSKVGGKRYQNNVRASSAGHLCKRKHFYDLTEPHEPPKVDLIPIFSDGLLHERDVEEKLRAMGYRVDSTQKEFRLENPLLSCHIDGMLSKDGGPEYPFDTKSINGYDFDKINCAEDLIFSKKDHQRNYPVQILTYMYATEKEYGLLIFKNKANGQIKQVVFSFDEHCKYLDATFKIIDQVYIDVKNKTPSERTDDRSLCAKCSWKNICLPDLLANGGIQFIDSEDLAQKLSRREELIESKDEYENLDSEIKEIVKQTGVGEKAVGDFLIQIKEVKTMRKKALTFTEEPSNYLKVSISKI